VFEEGGAREVIIARDDATASGCGKRGGCAASRCASARVQGVGGRGRAAGAIAETARRIDAIGARHDLLMAAFGHGRRREPAHQRAHDENHACPRRRAHQPALGDIFSGDARPDRYSPGDARIPCVPDRRDLQVERRAEDGRRARR